MLEFNFKNWVWNHLPPFFTRLGEGSLFFKLLNALCSAFVIVVQKLQTLQNQAILGEATGTSLDMYGVELKLEREDGENDADYRTKLIVLSTIYEGGISIANLKALTFAFFPSIDPKTLPEVYSAYQHQDENNKYIRYIDPQEESKTLALGLFDRDITKVFRRLAYYILLPDLNSFSVNRERYINSVLQVNYGANIPVILEKKTAATAITLGSSVLGTITSYITSASEPNIIFVERWY